MGPRTREQLAAPFQAAVEADQARYGAFLRACERTLRALPDGAAAADQVRGVAATGRGPREGRPLTLPPALTGGGCSGAVLRQGGHGVGRGARSGLACLRRCRASSGRGEGASGPPSTSPPPSLAVTTAPAQTLAYGPVLDQPHHCSSEEEVEGMLQGVERVLAQCPRPCLVTIARSADDGFTPPELADELEGRVIALLRRVYGCLHLARDEEDVDAAHPSLWHRPRRRGGAASARAAGEEGRD